jgi:hypothetical protein
MRRIKMKKIILALIIITITGCSTKNMVKFKVEKCLENDGTVERIQDENYRTVDIKCTERQKEKYIGE